MITDRETKITIREPRVMAVGVPLKIMSNGSYGTTGITGKIGLRIVKLRLQPLIMFKLLQKSIF
jgi:hypothetical protein